MHPKSETSLNYLSGKFGLYIVSPLGIDFFILSPLTLWLAVSLVRPTTQ